MVVVSVYLRHVPKVLILRDYLGWHGYRNTSGSRT